MTIFDILLLTGMGLWIAFLIWIMVCNQRTYNQCMRLIANASSGPDWRNDLAIIGKVSYSAHLFRLVFFRDWRVLYAGLKCEMD